LSYERSHEELPRLTTLVISVDTTCSTRVR
jgi:hypothetical protein